MLKKAIMGAFLGLLVLPLSSTAIELLAPPAEATLADGKVMVIGVGGKGDKGKADFAGQSTPFAVKDGKWSVMLTVPAGKQDVVFTVGSETVKAKWTVDPAQKKTAYKYHAGVLSEKCNTCHETAAKLTRDDQLAALCSRCHKPMDKLEYVHGPVAMGLCAACHDPHGSRLDKSLRLNVADLCVDCHNQPVTPRHEKAAGKELCTKCHNPHSSAKQYMIR